MRAVGAQPEAGGRNPDPVRDVQRSGDAEDRATTQHLDVRCQSLIVKDSFPLSPTDTMRDGELEPFAPSFARPFPRP